MNISAAHTVIFGDSLKVLPQMDEESIDTVVTSPPYWGIMDYGSSDQEIGGEDSPEEYVDKLVGVFSECRRVLKSSGSMWVNMGDRYVSTGGAMSNRPPSAVSTGRSRLLSNGGYSSAKRVVPAGYKYKDLLGLPWMLAIALQKDGWYLRRDVIWSKSNPVPDPVSDRPSTSHEYIFMFSKRPNYFYNTADAVERSADGGWRNWRSVWHIAVSSGSGIHAAQFPRELVERCLIATCPEQVDGQPGVVLDPFLGSGTTVMVAAEMNRRSVGIELFDSFRPDIERKLDIGSGTFCSFDVNFIYN
jgi:site-specific DNA-methyltransferase (cytosine-N4-specific)